MSQQPDDTARRLAPSDDSAAPQPQLGKLKQGARVPEAQDATDAIADAAERATHPLMNR